MPFFEEGHDPLDAVAGQLPGRMPMGPPEPDPFAGPNAAETISAAFRQHNFVVYLFDEITRPRGDQMPQPGYNPVPELSGTKYEPYIDQALDFRNPSQTASWKAKIDRDQADRVILAQAGWGGTFDSLVAATLNPLWLVLMVFWAYRRAKRAPKRAASSST